MTTLLIEEDGKVLLNKDRTSGISTVLVSGSLGGGTAVLGYTDGAGTFVPYTDGSVVTGGQYEVRHGSSGSVMLELTGSTGAALSVTVESI